LNVPTRQSFADAEVDRVAAIAESLWGVSCGGVRVPDEHREKTLYSSVRESALAYFRDGDLRWWTYRDEKAGRPTSLLRSSQVACVNHLEPARRDERLAIAVGRALGLDAVAGIRIDGGFLAYEWIGERNFLGERRWGRRGERCTSLDAFMPLRLADGRVLGLVIEWKYTERPRGGSEAVSKDGTSRVALYRPLLDAPGCPVDLRRLDRIEDLFADPYTQLMRQALVAWQIAEHGEAGVDDWLHIHVVPAGNQPMRNPPRKLTAAGHDLTTQWRSVLKEPDRYLLVTPTELLAEMPKHVAPLGWRDWLSLRYAT
jgi:hypothetical protein